jgi:N-acetylmuramoyl-L-alanine amidase
LVICLDPGHPSETSPGNARLLNGLREVEVVYDIALALQPVLERDLGATVVLTREFRTASEGKVTNRKRAEIANAAHADLFLRLHCDAGPSASSGFAVYYPDCPGTVAGVTGPTADVRTRSERAAYAFHAGMADDLASALPNNGVKGDSATAVGARQGALTGSIFARVPTITVEMAFLTNPDDARFIASPDGQVRMVRALAAGVRRALGR